MLSKRGVSGGVVHQHDLGYKTIKEKMCVFWVGSYLEVLLDLVSALLMTSEGADCRLWANVFIF